MIIRPAIQIGVFRCLAVAGVFSLMAASPSLAAPVTFAPNPGPKATPEPATLALIGGGFIGLGILRRSRKLVHS
jgi:hypothetical protein